MWDRDNETSFAMLHDHNLENNLERMCNRTAHFPTWSSPVWQQRLMVYCGSSRPYVFLNFTCIWLWFCFNVFFLFQLNLIFVFFYLRFVLVPSILVFSCFFFVFSFWCCLDQFFFNFIYFFSIEIIFFNSLINSIIFW